MQAYLDFARRTPVLIATLVTTLVLLFAVFPALPIDGDLLDVRSGYTHEEVVVAMDRYGEQGRRVYAWSAATLDTLLPLVYVSLLAGAVYRFRPTERAWRLVWLPVAAGALDLGENVQIIVMLTRYPDVSAGQVAMASLFTQWKGYALLFSLALAAVLAVVAAVRRDRRAPDATS